MSKQPLTNKQARVLLFIENYIAQHGFSPTFREIGKHAKKTGRFPRSVAAKYVETLIRKGYIRTNGNTRGIKIKKV